MVYFGISYNLMAAMASRISAFELHTKASDTNLQFLCSTHWNPCLLLMLLTKQASSQSVQPPADLYCHAQKNAQTAMLFNLAVAWQADSGRDGLLCLPFMWFPVGQPQKLKNVFLCLHCPSAVPAEWPPWLPITIQGRAFVWHQLASLRHHQAACTQWGKALSRSSWAMQVWLLEAAGDMQYAREMLRTYVC